MSQTEHLKSPAFTRSSITSRKLTGTISGCAGWAALWRKQMGLRPDASHLYCFLPETAAGDGYSKSGLTPLKNTLEQILDQHRREGGLVRQRGKLYVFEGPDGVGKTELSRRFTAMLNERARRRNSSHFQARDEGTIGKLVYDLHHAPQSFGVDEGVLCELAADAHRGTCRCNRERDSSRAARRDLSCSG